MIRSHKILPWVVSFLATCLLIVAVDMAFRWYEARFLTTSLDAVPGPYDLTALGYHHHGGPVSREKPAGGLRVLSLGDSFAYAITTPSLTYSALTQQLLQQRADETGRHTTVEVVNLGVPSISFPEYIRQGTFWGGLLEHDAVVLNIYTGNDFHDVKDTMVTPAALRKRGVSVGLSTRIPRKYPLRMVDYFFAYAKTMEQEAVLQPENASEYEVILSGDIDRERYGRIMRNAGAIYAPAQLQEQLASLAWCREALRMLAHAAHQGKTVRVLVSPPHFWASEEWLTFVQSHPNFANSTLDPALPAEIVRQLAQTEGLDPDVVIDLLPELQAKAAQGVPMYKGTNTHWTVEGNAVAAAALARSLEETLLPGTEAGPSEARTISSKQEGDAEARSPHAAAVTQALAALHGAGAFEGSWLEGVATGEYARQAQLKAALEAMGLQEISTMKGLVDSIHTSRQGDSVLLEGWALDSTQPSRRLIALAFYEGSLVGSGVVQVVREDAARRFNATGPLETRCGFSFLIDAPSARGNWNDLWVVAVDLNGAFGFLRTDDWVELTLHEESPS